MKQLLVVLVVVALAACGEDRLVLHIGPERVPCTGVAEQQCLLVREDPDDDWEYFYDEIRGFVYEEGFEYTILVRRERVDPVAADASSIRYTLIRILHREAVARILTDVKGQEDGPPAPSFRSGLAVSDAGCGHTRRRTGARPCPRTGRPDRSVPMPSDVVRHAQ